MLKIEKNKMKYDRLFKDYTHNIPVIYSSLEGQYGGQLYVNHEEDCRYALLMTPFNFAFVGGNPQEQGVDEQLHHLLFHVLVKEKSYKELIVFCPDEKWFPILERVFSQHNRIKDVRKNYSLNREKFIHNNKEMIHDIEIKANLVYEHDFGSTIDYPVCRIYKANQCVSFCSAFMLGKNHAELDVFTEPEYRGKGYGKLAVSTLISELLEKDIIPDWCTWPYRFESQKLAESIGFELSQEVKAFIWVEEVCGGING